MNRTVLVVGAVVLAGGLGVGVGKVAHDRAPPSAAPATAPAPTPLAPDPAAPAEQPDPADVAYQAEADEAYDRLVAGAVPVEQLEAFAPPSLGGVAKTNTLRETYALAAAYGLDDGGYANLDIKNTFRRGGMDLEDRTMAACPRKETVAGHVACVHLAADRAAFHWDLPDRLTVDLAAPTEALARQMATELPLAAIAALSAQR